MSNPSLLLLSPPPEPATQAALAAAYRPSLGAVISHIKGGSSTTRLFLVIPCPAVRQGRQGPRSQVFQATQQVLAGVYSLLCLVCTELNVDAVESLRPGSIDFRIILVNDGSIQEIPTLQPSTQSKFPAGPIVDLASFALTRRCWNLIFSVDGEQGQSILRRYLELGNQISPPIEGQFQVISGGLTMIQKHAEDIPTATTIHTVVAVGGTFDHLHAGHKLLLTATALLLQPSRHVSSQPGRLIVGITGDGLLKNKKYAEYIKSWDKRQEDVLEFLVSIISFSRSPTEEEIETTVFDRPGPNGQAVHTALKQCSVVIECVEIQDAFGPTITDESVSALVVSKETRSGGQAVNEKRSGKGWKTLDVFEVDVLDAQDVHEAASKREEFDSKISSTAIRRHMAEDFKT